MGGFRGVDLNPVRQKKWQDVLGENGIEIREDPEVIPNIVEGRVREKGFLVKIDGIEIPVLEYLENDTGKFGIVFINQTWKQYPLVVRMAELVEDQCK